VHFPLFLGPNALKCGASDILRQNLLIFHKVRAFLMNLGIYFFVGLWYNYKALKYIGDLPP
jgi:hypothetical protein